MNLNISEAFRKKKCSPFLTILPVNVIISSISKSCLKLNEHILYEYQREFDHFSRTTTDSKEYQLVFITFCKGISHKKYSFCMNKLFSSVSSLRISENGSSKILHFGFFARLIRKNICGVECIYQYIFKKVYINIYIQAYVRR